MDSNNKYLFPVKPYKIQEEFCKEAWRVYDNEGGIGIFESPTGTGKTLSVLCSSLSWIKNKTSNNTCFTNTKKINTPAWVLNALNRNKQNITDTISQRKKEFFKYLSEISNSSNKTLEDILAIIADNSSNNEINHYRVIISSRTHSQLMQYIDEIKRINSLINFNNFTKEIVTVTPLASRTQLCINQKVRLYPATIIRDICHQYTKQADSVAEKCVYRENSTLLARKSLLNPMNIEELCNIGIKMNACPYYATKEAGKYSDIILLPYSTIFNKIARDSFQIKLDQEKTLFIIDEAHNLISALESTNRVFIELESLQILARACEKVMSLHFLKLQSINIAILKQLIRLIKSIYIGTHNLVKNNKRLRNQEDVQENNILLSPIDFIETNNIDSFNISKISTFIMENELCKKIKETIIKFGKEFFNTQVDYQELILKSNSIYTFSEFLNSFIISDREFDKILIESSSDNQNNTKVTLTLIPINIQSKFNHVYLNTRATMLVGGTLEPITEFKPLISSTDHSKIIKFSANHQLSKRNVMCLIIPKSINNDVIDLRYEFRFQETQLKNLCDILYAISSEIPDGICVFFTSYIFLEIFYKHLHILSRDGTKYYELIVKNKKIFREKAKDAENSKDLLKAYKDHIFNKNDVRGGMLLAVLNGSLSEGVNFSDQLCRGLVVVSLPFPNKTKILKSKEEYFKSNDNLSIDSGDDYRKIVCMKIVNQCIGRAIRHKEDYSIVILLDSRYQTSEIKNMLPKWLIEHIMDNSKTSEWNFELNVLNYIREFFKNRKIE